MQPTKIAIVGSPGAGKSTFARRLQKATGLPLYHLDQVHFSANWQHKYDAAGWLQFLRELTAKDRWIIDGNYFNTLEERIRTADLVIYLQISPLRALRRVIQRRIQYHETARPDAPEGCREQLHPHLFKSIFTYPFRSHPRIMRLLATHKTNAVFLKNSKQMDEFLRKF